MQLRRFAALLLMTGFLAFTACSDDSGTGPDTDGDSFPTLTSDNVKTASVYYSFDSEANVHVYDLKFATVGDFGSPEFFLNDAKLADSHVMIYDSGETDFAGVTTVDAAMLGTDPESLITGDNWYTYNPQTHQLNSNGAVYVLSGANGSYLKFHIRSYSQGVFTVDYALYDATSESFGTMQTVVIDVSEGEQYFSSAAGGLITQQDWDIKMAVLPTEVPNAGTFNFPAILMNSGAGVKGAMIDDQNFADVDAAAAGNLQGEEEGAWLIGTDWFNYDQNTHRVSSKEAVYVIETTGGKRVKFQVQNYYNEQGESGYISMRYDIAG